MSHAPRSIEDLDFTPVAGVHPSPRDWRDHPIYFLLVDRFDNDDPSVPAYEAATAPRGRVPQEGRHFQGGNLKGVMRRLDYIRDLGFTAVWISPVLKNRQENCRDYHGYATQDFLQVDPRFGTLQDLQALVRAAHAKGMYVIMDIVVQHTGDNWTYEGGWPRQYEGGHQHEFGSWRQIDATPGLQDDDGVWPVELQDPDSYKRRGSISNWDDPEQSLHGDFYGLKELKLGNGALGTIIDVYKYWIAAADIDGLRVDTVKHMQDTTVALFCNAVREYARRIGKDNFFIFGEVATEDDTKLNRYIGRNTRIDPGNERFPSLDACLDFPLHSILDHTIKGLMPPEKLIQRYERVKEAYTDHGAASAYFVTFVDNHDQLYRGDKRFLHADEHTRQAVLAMGYLLTSRGVPCIYYGTEQAFDGGGSGDEYIRECMFGGKWGAFNTTGMHFFDPNHWVYRELQAIGQVRRQEGALRYGRQYFRQISGDGVHFGTPIDGRCTLAFSRILDTEEVLIAMNLDLADRNDCVNVDCDLTPPGAHMRDLLGGLPDVLVEQSGGRAFVRVPLGPHRMAILKRK